MAISKGTIATGILGTGGGITGTTLVVKYVASKSESSEKSTVNPEQNIKDQINQWVSSKNNCKIKIKWETSGDDSSAKELKSGLEGKNAEELQAFLNGLKNNIGTPTAESICTSINGQTDKFMLAKKGSDGTNTTWTFEGPKP